MILYHQLCVGGISFFGRGTTKKQDLGEFVVAPRREDMPGIEMKEI